MIIERTVSWSPNRSTGRSPCITFIVVSRCGPKLSPVRPNGLLIAFVAIGLMAIAEWLGDGRPAQAGEEGHAAGVEVEKCRPDHCG